MPEASRAMPNQTRPERKKKKKNTTTHLAGEYGMLKRAQNRIMRQSVFCGQRETIAVRACSFQFKRSQKEMKAFKCSSKWQWRQ